MKGSLDLVPINLHDTTKQSKDCFTSAATASKTKKRGPVPRADLVVPQRVIAEPQVEHQPTLHVNKRVLQNLRALFYDKSSGSTETPWVDFAQAMVSIGLSATKTQGSDWQFIPRTLVINRSISIHEPHPEKRLSHVQARRIGFRLNNGYGWTRDTFHLAKK